jgi:glutaredoxin
MIMTAPLTVELLTRRDCGLCAKAAAALDAVAAEVPLVVVERDIDLDEDLLREFHIRVPVVRVGEVVLSEGVVTEASLRAAIGALGGEVR